MIAVVVLAAGEGSRLGGGKLLLDFGGEPLLRRTVRAAVEAALGPVVAVLPPGAHGAALRAALAPVEEVRTIENPAADTGMNGSLRLGVAAVPSEADAVIVSLGDMPFVGADALRALAARWREAGATAHLVAARYGDVVAPPVLYPRALFGELAGGPPGDGHGRAVLRRHAGSLVVVDLPPAALADVDDPEGLARARARAAGQDAGARTGGGP